MNEQSFEQNTIPEDPHLREYRKDFSLVGFAFLIMVGLEFLISLFVSAFVVPSFPELADSGKIWYWLYIIVAQYVISMPLGFLVLRMGKKKEETTNSTRLSGVNMLVVTAVSFAMIYIGGYISTFINNLCFNLFGLSSESNLPALSNSISAIMSFIIIVVLAPIMEELLFRKALLDVLKPYGEKTAVMIGALIFALAHQNIGQAVYAFLAGATFGMIYIRTGKLRYSIFIHMLINLMCGFLPQVVQLLISNPEEYSQLINDFYNVYMKLLVSGGEVKEEVLDVFKRMYAMLPYMALSSLVNNLSLGLAAAGVILMPVYRKKLKFRRGEITIRREDKGYAIFLAPGLMIFILFSIAMIALSFFI